MLGWRYRQRTLRVDRVVVLVRQVSVYLSDEDEARLVAVAGREDRTVSKQAVRYIVAGLDLDEPVVLERAPGVPVTSSHELVAATRSGAKRTGMCVHRVPAGSFCSRCDS